MNESILVDERAAFDDFWLRLAEEYIRLKVTENGNLRLVDPPGTFPTIQDYVKV